MQPFFQGKQVIITGGGGSIGSELCRQIASQNPDRLVIADINENGAFTVEQELLSRYGRDFPVAVEIVSIRDKQRIQELFRQVQPNVILHAAAHKHVPYMEHNPQEAVKNNILGTWNVINAAEQYGTERLVLISTDKAVHPTSVMGASKAITEKMLFPGGKTVKAAVRFGNVAESAGSVLPLFRQQIEKGGPITVTDPRMTRYFMTIPEAAELVLKAAEIAENGDLMVLDMGEPVSILDLAKKLAAESECPDMEIQFTGLRPGEKLQEELLTEEERRNVRKIGKILRTKVHPFSREELSALIPKFQEAAQSADRQQILSLLKQVLPDYTT